MYAEVWFNGRTRSHDDFIRTELTDESAYTCTYWPFSPQACEAFQQIWSYRIIINCIHQYQSFRSFLYDNCNSTIKARDATLKLSPHWTVLDPLFGIPISSENSFTWCHITLQQRPYTGGVCVFTIQIKHFLPKNNSIPFQHLVSVTFTYSSPPIDKQQREMAMVNIKPNWQT